MLGNHQGLFKVTSGFRVRQQFDIMLAVFKKCNVLALQDMSILKFLNLLYTPRFSKILEVDDGCHGCQVVPQYELTVLTLPDNMSGAPLVVCVKSERSLINDH